MCSWRVVRVVISSLTAIVSISSARAAEETIDSLLNRLPPPNKLVRPHVQQALQDPALKDPLANRVFAAADPAKALSLARQLAQKDPKSALAQLLHGATAMDMRQWPEAEQALRSSIAIAADRGITQLALGVVEIVQHRYAAALSPLQEANRLQPSWAIGWLLCSHCATELGHREESLTFAKRATSIEPNWVYAWLQLGRAEKAMGRPQETLNAVARAAALSPNDSEMQAIVGFGYINLNRITQAIPPLEHAARLDPNDYLIQGQLGYCLEMTGQYKAAVEHLRKATSLNANYGPGWEQLGLAYQKQGRHPDSINAYQRATQLMPNSRLSWQHLAQEYRTAGRLTEAAQAASHASLGQIAVATKTKKK
jgi:tetratricopeptide (TPR) repeat protein